MFRKKYTQQRAVFSMKIEYRVEGDVFATSLRTDCKFNL